MPMVPPMTPANQPAFAARYMITNVAGTGATESTASSATAITVSAPTCCSRVFRSGSTNSSPNTANGRQTSVSTNRRKSPARTVWREGSGTAEGYSLMRPVTRARNLIA